MTIVVTGGGSGGHITPILAVAHALKQQRPNTRIVYIGQKGDKLADIPAGDPSIDEVFTVSAGKFRRYNGEGWWQLFDLKTQFLNIRDGFRVVAGIWQSYRLLRKLKPAIIFSRGGFVSVPVALGGRLNRVPYVTHDSDSVPSLANRLIARWAVLHAVALPKEVYPYPPAKTQTVGIPLSDKYELMTPTLIKQYRHQLDLPLDAELLLVTGGGNGAQPLNDAVVANTAYMLQQRPKLHIVHIAGRALETAVATAYDTEVTGEARQRIEIVGFTTDFHLYSGAADVIVARAGATNLAEFAVQGKACIIVPAGHLVGGHQVKNAQVFADHAAIMLFTQDQAEQERRLGSAVIDLLGSDKKRAALGAALHTFAQTNAAETLATLLLEKAA